MRYAAVVAASAAVVGTLVFARDGRSASAPEVRAAAARTASAAPARQQLAAAPALQEDFRWSGRLARGKTIEIRGIAGDVRAEATSGDQVEVVGQRRGDDAARVRIEVVEREDGVLVCAVYPTRRSDSDGGRRGRSDDPCNGDGDSQVDMDDIDDARVNFIVRVPAGVRFESAIVAGNVYATDLRSDVEVATVSGNVRVSTTGTARASTVSGNVEATFGEMDGDEAEFNSVSGDVILRLAGDVNADVSAHTLSGDIDSDFDLDMRGEDDDDEDGFHIQIGREASGTIGRGGPELSVNTVSGNIRLERAR